MSRVAALFLVLAPLSVACADDLDSLDNLSQQQFGLLAQDLAGVLAYRGLQAAEPYGSIGFDAGIETSVVRPGNDAVWRDAGANDASALPLLRISATKGLPFGFDAGGFIGVAPDAGLRSLGVQLRYALVEGGVTMPAIGLRAAATHLDGVDQLDYDTRSLDVSVSKGFGPATPYAGYGRIWANAEPDAATGLAGEDIAENRAYIGCRLTFVVLQLALEADRTGDTAGYSLKLAFGF